MKKMHQSIWVLLLIIQQTMTAMSPGIKFKSSLCYDRRGDVVVELRCPDEYKIRTRAAFTGISASNMCSFSATDCAIHEGRTYRCDGNNRCQVHVSFRQDVQPLSCGRTTTVYFQVEYDCLAASGDTIEPAHIGLQEDVVASSIYSKNIPKRPGSDWLDGWEANTTLIDATKQSNPSGDKFKLMSIIGGTCVGLIIFVAVLAAIVRRLHNKSYPQSLYRSGQRQPSNPLGSLARSIPSRLSRGSDRLSHSRESISHCRSSQHSRKSSVGIGLHSQGDSGLGQGSSDLSAPGSVSSLFPKQSLRDLQLLRGYPPREIERAYRENVAYPANIDDIL